MFVGKTIRVLDTAVTTTIHGEPVQLVKEYKYLGTIFDSLLKFSSNTKAILKKFHQRQYLLRKLNSFGVSKIILQTFYYSFIESIITFSITCWFHSTTLQNRNHLQRTATVCSKIIGLPLMTFNMQASEPYHAGPFALPLLIVRVAPIGSPASLPCMQDTEEKGYLCSKGCHAPQLIAPLPTYTHTHPHTDIPHMSTFAHSTPSWTLL